ncbi:endonuclease III [Anaplasma marginale]|uniref:Endonuclease III n=1 Tax=Anaplasma centrale (strain Israel) TaxID=574556 RepID=D1ASI4_ANACI|nr:MULTISPECIES: endonuclease III [Anaplasma]ACZ49437.1 endonuclease 3 [Anaplasma centrale str. Israel]AXW84815.1 endonuclease III [Anaplasma marginale]
MKDVDLLFGRFSEDNPHPRIELRYRNEFTLLVAIVLSARTTDVSVNKITDKLFDVADSPQKMLALGEDGLKSYINSIGLYNSKAKNIIKLSEIIVKDYGGVVPQDFDTLTDLPGVGRKSASVFLNSAFGIPAIAVDTHVFRVSNRIGLVKESTVLGVENSLNKVVPEKWKLYAHHWLVLHGRYVCKARAPLCHKCIINDLCDSRDQWSQS